MHHPSEVKALATALFVMLAGTFAACEITEAENGYPCVDCDAACDGEYVPRTGTAFLTARTLWDDYEAATVSFEHAATWDDGYVYNDWDLLFGNDYEPEEDLFSVNMVVDDESYIVDLGDVTLCDVPLVVEPDAYEPGMYGTHDNIPVACGHAYVVRTVDSDTRQVAAFIVQTHDLNQFVSIAWYRSPDPDRFIPPVECR
jgi:hypothetical protein